MKNNYEYIKRLKLSIQSALLGAITENIRNVAVYINEKKFYCIFLLTGKSERMIKKIYL